MNDILVDGAFDEAAQGMDYVLHVASPITRPVSRLPRKGGIAEQLEHKPQRTLSYVQT